MTWSRMSDQEMRARFESFVANELGGRPLHIHAEPHDTEHRLLCGRPCHWTYGNANIRLEVLRERPRIFEDAPLCGECMQILAKMPPPKTELLPLVEIHADGTVTVQPAGGGEPVLVGTDARVELL